MNYSAIIKAEAHRLGFMYCGISKAEFLEEDAPRLEQWLNKNMHGSMGYMANHFDKKLNPQLLMEGAKSVVSLLLNYYPDHQSSIFNLQSSIPNSPKISKYAYGKDYHYVIKNKLKELMDFIHNNIGMV